MKEGRCYKKTDSGCTTAFDFLKESLITVAFLDVNKSFTIYTDVKTEHV